MKWNAHRVSFPRQWTVFGVYPRASTQPDASAVDRQTGLLRRDTLTVIADREAGIHRMIEFSNLGLYEDRLTHELVVCLPRFYPNATGQSYIGDLLRYRIDRVAAKGGTR